MDSDLATLAANLVQYVAEIKKPDGERLPGYHEAQLESLRFRMYSPAPVYKDMEIARIEGALALDIQEVSATDAYMKILLDGKSPRQQAEALVNGTKLTDA